jgi:hypothetical protein
MTHSPIQRLDEAFTKSWDSLKVKVKVKSQAVKAQSPMFKR